MKRESSFQVPWVLTYSFVMAEDISFEITFPAVCVVHSKIHNSEMLHAKIIL